MRGKRGKREAGALPFMLLCCRASQPAISPLSVVVFFFWDCRSLPALGECPSSSRERSHMAVTLIATRACIHLDEEEEEEEQAAEEEGNGLEPKGGPRPCLPPPPAQPHTRDGRL